MLVKDFKGLISVDSKIDESGNSPVVLELKNRSLWLTYTWIGGVVTKKSIPWDEEGEWIFATTLGRLKEAIGKKSRSASEITISVADDQTLMIKTLMKTEKGDRPEGKSDQQTAHQVLPWGIKPELDLDSFEGDSQTLVLNVTAWEEIRQASNVIVHDLNKNEKEPHGVMSSYVRLDIWKDSGFATGYTPTMISYRSFTCMKKLNKSRVYLLPVTLIALIGTLKLDNPAIALRLSADKKQLLTTVDGNFFLTEVPSEVNYPSLDGILRERDENSLVVIEDKMTLQAALQAAKDAGVINITLSFKGGEITMDAGKKHPKTSFPASSEKKFMSTVRLGVALLLDALKAMNVAKIFLLFPISSGKALIIESLTGIIYLILAITKVTNHLIDEAKATEKQLGIEKAPNGEAFSLVAVEENPLPKLKGETPEQRLIEAQSHVTEILAKVTENQKTMENQIEGTIKKLEEIEKLEQALEESEDILSSGSEEYRLQELEAVSLKLFWSGGRLLNVLLHKDPDWRLEIRMIEPKTKNLGSK